jgi:hypothetical protein
MDPFRLVLGQTTFAITDFSVSSMFVLNYITKTKGCG